MTEWNMPVPDVLHTVREMDLYRWKKRKVYVTDRETPYPEGLLITSRTDLDGIITHANDAFVHLSGWSREELIGAPHSLLRHPDMPSAAFSDLWETVQQGRKWHGYVKNLCKDGSYYWVYATVIPNIRQGKICAYTSVRRQASAAKIAQAEALYRTMQ